MIVHIPTSPNDFYMTELTLKQHRTEIADRQTDRQTDKQAGRQTDRQTGRQRE